MLIPIKISLRRFADRYCITCKCHRASEQAVFTNALQERLNKANAHIKVSAELPTPGHAEIKIAAAALRLSFENFHKCCAADCSRNIAVLNKRD